MNWTDLDRQYCWHPFTQAQTANPPLTIVKGQGAYLFDDQGQAYIDAISSWWVNLHGHSHPKIAAAIAHQATELEHVMFAGITHPPAVQLAQQLVAHLPKPLQYVFYSDNGSTAIEVALKMACQYWRNKNIKRHRFLAFQGAYHGDTFGAMSVGKTSGFYDPYTDWMFAVDFLPYPSITQLDTSHSNAKSEREESILQHLDQYLDQYAEELVAFILEPLVQGAAGMRIARPEFLRTLLTRVRAHGIPIIFDEVMTGFGRTGSLFAAEQIGITPDLLCLSKGLTGGFLPMAATVAQPHIYEAFLDNDVGKALLHGHSYTANPLGCAAALASLNLFAEEKTLDRIEAIKQTHQIGLSQLSQHPAIINTRQCGTIAAFEMRHPTNHIQAQSSSGQWLREYMRGHHILLRPLGTTVYLIPPYCLSASELAHIYAMLRQALDEWLSINQNTRTSDLF